MDLGTIGLNIETTGDETAKQKLDNYLASVRRTRAELQKFVQEQQSFAEIRSTLASKEVRDSMSYWRSIQSLEKQKIQSIANEDRARQRQFQENMRITAAMQSLGNQRQAALAQEARAAERAIEQEERARQRLFQENMRVTSSMQSLANQREAALAEEARAAEQATQREEQARKQLLQENMRITAAMQSLANQREAALAEEARAAERAIEVEQQARQRQFQENMRITAAMQSLANQREAALAAEARAVEEAARQAQLAEQRKYREAERIADAITSLDNQRQNAIKEQQRELEQLENQYRQLAGSLDPATRAQQRYDASMNLLNRALRKNIIDIHEHAEAVRQLNAQMVMGGYAVNQYGQVLSGVNRTAFRASRDGLQQLGYQVGDFAVQLQYGTPFLIAFAQQGSQLLQIFGPWGAIAGAALAITAALGTAFAGTASRARSLEEDVRDLDTALSSVRDTMGLINDDELAFRFGSLTDEVRDLASSMILLDQAASLTNLRDTLERLSTENIEPGFGQRMISSFAAGMGGMAAGTSGIPTLGYEDFLGAFREENFRDLGFAMAYETFDGLKKGIEESAALGETADVVRGIRDLYTQAVPDLETATKVASSGGLEMLRAFSDTALATAETVASLDGSAEASREAAELAAQEALERERAARAAERAAEVYDRNIESGSKIWDNLQNELDLQLAINQYGVDSNEAREVRNRIEAEALGLRLQQLYAAEGITEEEEAIIASVIQVNNALQVARDTREDSVRAAREEAEAAEEQAKLLAAQEREQERIAQAAERLREVYERNLLSGEGIIRNLENEAQLQALINEFGVDSQAVRDERNRQEAASLRLLLEQLYASEGITAEEQNIIDRAMEAVAQLQAARDAADATKSNLGFAANEALRLRDALSQVQMASLSRSEQATILRAQIAAAREGRSVEGAAAGAEVAMALGRTSASADMIASVAMEAAASAEEVANLRQELNALTNPSTGGGGAGNTSAVTDGLREARQLFTETRTEAEIYAAEIQRINDLHKEFPEIVTEDVVNRALKQLQEGLDDTAQVAQRLEQAFARTATSIVMGSESAQEAVSNLLMALAEMAIQAAFMGILKSAFNPVAWIFTPGALPSANGNVFSGGGMVPFQQGGVVNDLTYFPMAGNQTGMMSEEGPEAIMPLRRDSKGRLGVHTDGQPQRVILEVRAEEGEMFVPRIRQISGNVAVQISAASMRAQNSALGASITEFDQRGTS